MNIYHVNIRQIEKIAPIERWMDQLPENMTLDIGGYKKVADQFRVLGGKLLLKYALSTEETNHTLSEIVVSPKGKLHFPESSFVFNISHSGDHVVLLTAKDHDCGIDIEKHREVNIDMFRRLFTEGEWEVITGSEDPLALFFKCWAIKESVIKADGRGVEVISKTEIISNTEVICDGRKWNFLFLDLVPDYALSIATDVSMDGRPLKLPPIIEFNSSHLKTLLNAKA